MFNIKKSKNSLSRTATIRTPHGAITTPAFFPDATYGALKSITFDDARQAGVEQLVTTTLHLETKMNSENVNAFGGIHKFLGWDRPIITDSGGFQVFSLIHRNDKQLGKITDVGVTFADPATGDYKLLTPETSQQIQHNLGSDIRVVLDEPPIRDTSISYVTKALKRTTKWAIRSKEMFLKLNKLTNKDFDNPKIKRPLLTAVIQGGNYPELRKQSAVELIEIGFDIYGFGGMPLYNHKSWRENAPKGFNQDIVSYVASLIPEDKIRYGLGIGTPDDLKMAIEAGWDIFDTVLPTRNARHGYLYVEKGDGDNHYDNYSVLHIKRKEYENDKSPINKNSKIKELRETSRAYLRYLFRIKEVGAQRLATLNNLEFYSAFMKKLS